MKKFFRKSLALLLTLTLITSGMVFILPAADAVSLPGTLYNNGSAAVNYTASDAKAGKYLVEIDAVKYTDTAAASPSVIDSEAGDITIVYKPDNGLSAAVSTKLEDIIRADEFYAEGDKSVAYYAIIDGFPVKANISVLKNNTKENDTGLYSELKVWDITRGLFSSVFDYRTIQKSNGVGTSNLIFSDISSTLTSYPYAASGSAANASFTLPSGIDTPTSANVDFAVTDQWGVTMVNPSITHNEVVGLTFSQNASVMTVSGTGDANNPNGSSRTITLSASYETLNPNAASTYTASANVTVRNSSVMTYAPTYENREKGGLSAWFVGSSTSSVQVNKFALNSAYQITGTPYLYIKNNSSRKATVTNITTASSSYISIASNTATINAGGEVRIKITDNKSAASNYSGNVTITYTLDGLYAASTGSIATLTTGANAGFIYNKTTAPRIHVYDKPWNQREVNCYVGLTSNAGILNQTAKDDGKEYNTWTVDYYIDRESYSSYQSTGLGFSTELDKSNKHVFNKEEKYAGTYQLTGSYYGSGTFGFSSSSASAATTAVQERINASLGSSDGDTAFIPFYGTIFTPANSVSPARIAFSKLQIHCPDAIANSGYFTLDFNVYAYNKANLKTALNNYEKAYLSCFYNSAKWNAFADMASSSAMGEAINVMAKDMVSQGEINTAVNNLQSAYSNLTVTKGTYIVNHYRHSGDINSDVVATSVDFYSMERGATASLKFNNDFSAACNKHSASYRASMPDVTTSNHTYEYWNIDFSALTGVLDSYNELVASGAFSNVEEAMSEALEEVNGFDMSEDGAAPLVQNDVSVAANNFSNAMRNLEFTSFDMNVTHKMLNPSGTTEIDNDVIHTKTEVYNKTATYGEYVDGTANIDDGSYTIKAHRYAAQPDETFMEYASSYFVAGISSNFKVTGTKNVTVTYYAKSMDDPTLSELINDTINNIGEWKKIYTPASIEEFEEWFNTNYDDGTLTYGFSIFDTEEYEALVAEYRAQLDKLDLAATDVQMAAIEQFISNYDMVMLMPDAYCYSNNLLNEYSDEYANCQAMLQLYEQGAAGKKAAQEVIDSTADFQAIIHSPGSPSLLVNPEDGVDGRYVCACTNCKEVVSSGALGHPMFNNYTQSYYNYANRGAALRYVGEDVNSATQGMRFPAAVLVPEGATVTDFGFAYTQTRYINGGTEPENNTSGNVNGLTSSNQYVTMKSLKDGKYSVHNTDNGDVYTFNLVINVSKTNWAKHYAARGYVTYTLNGITMTVYDRSFSSRSVNYLAQCVAANATETQQARAFVSEKFDV